MTKLTVYIIMQTSHILMDLFCLYENPPAPFKKGIIIRCARTRWGLVAFGLYLFIRHQRYARRHGRPTMAAQSPFGSAGRMTSFVRSRVAARMFVPMDTVTGLSVLHRGDGTPRRLFPPDAARISN